MTSKDKDEKMINEKNIYQRINSVMKDVSYIKKDATISGSGPTYAAVTHDQVISSIRKSLIDNGIVIQPVQTNSEMLITRDPDKNIKMHLYAGKYNVFFVNIDNPDDKTYIAIEAHAADNGDKAPGKCLTYATKAAILKMFSLETGVNDESRTEVRVDNEYLQKAVAAMLECLDNKDGAGLLEITAEMSKDEQISVWKQFNTHQKSTIRELTNAAIRVKDGDMHEI